MKGSIIERGLDKGKKNGKRKTFTVVIDLERDENGKRKQKWFGGYKTKSEAEKARVELLYKLEHGEVIVQERTSVNEYMEYWLSRYARRNVAKSTYKRYKEFAKHICRNLGNLDLQDLTAIRIQEFYESLQETESSKPKVILSGSTVLKIHRMFKLALNHAIGWELINKNPVLSVQAPKANESEMKIWDVETIIEFLEKVKDEKIFIAVVIAIGTGMREGEISALRWKDVDLKNKKIYIQSSMQINTEGEDISLKRPKTKASKRNIYLMDMTVKILEEYKLKQELYKAIWGEEHSEEGFICTKDNGIPLSPQYVSKRFATLVKRYNLPVIRFHDLRHTHASLLFQQKVDVKIISERLGHSRVSTTQDIYIHMVPGMQEEAVDKLEEVFKHKIMINK